MVPSNISINTYPKNYGHTYNILVTSRGTDVSITSKSVYRTDTAAFKAAQRFLRKHPSIWNYEL